MRKVVVAVVVLVLFAPAAHGAESNVPVRRALIVGINDYAGRTVDTVGGAGDADDLRLAVLEAGFDPANVRVLVDGAATAQAIRDGLRWLGDTSNDDTFSVFHYSGHVKQYWGDPDGDGEDHDEYLWGHDNQFIADSELAAWVKRIRGRVWVDISGCEASGLDDGINAPNRLVTVSSAESEKSFEHPGWRNSVFTGLLVDQGIRSGRADTTGAGRVSIQEAFMLAARQAPEITANQRPGPQHPEMRGGDGTWWYLDGRPPAEPEAEADEKTCFLLWCS